jgi:uncharacterized Zn-binding protein involved in type VI secretion
MAQGSGNVFVNGIPFSRQGIDLTAGHCFPPVPVMAASPNVFVNGSKADRVGDPISPHCCGNSCHAGSMANGSPDVFVNQGAGSPSSVVVLVERHVQPGVNKLIAAQVLADDPGVSPTFREYRRIKEAEAGIVLEEPTFVELAPATTFNPAFIPAECSDIIAHQGKFPGSFSLSPNFTLEMLTTDTLVSNYPLQANAGLTEKEVVCNLRFLCVNVLEPMYAQYGDALTINSAFRYDASSQHGKGQAADISFKNLTTERQWWDRAVEIQNTFAYDQYIYEAERSVWYHMSFNTEGNRRIALTKPRRSNTYYAGIQRILT